MNHQTRFLAPFLDSVWNRYKDNTGLELSRMTHQPKTAWYVAWEKNSPFLSDDDIEAEPVEEI